jgi:hypothetical protein
MYMCAQKKLFIKCSPKNIGHYFGVGDSVNVSNDIHTLTC